MTPLAAHGGGSSRRPRPIRRRSGARALATHLSRALLAACGRKLSRRPWPPRAASSAGKPGRYEAVHPRTCPRPIRRRSGARALATHLSRALLALVVATFAASAAAVEVASMSAAGVGAPTATELYEASRKAWQEGDHDRAIALLERAWDTFEEPTFVFNIGVVLEESGRYEEALDAYRRYVTVSNDGAGIEQAVERMEATREKFGKGRLTILADASDVAVFVDGADIGWAPVERVLVSAGSHQVRVQAPGVPPLELVATVQSGETRELAVNLRPAPPSVGVVAEGPSAPSDGQLQTWGVAVATTGGAALTAGIVLVVLGEDRRNGGYDGSGDLERAIGVGLTTAGVLAATAGVVMAVLGDGPEPAPAAWVAPIGLGGFAAGGSF